MYNGLMHTEDDTFRHLTRKPFEEVRDIIIGLAVSGASPAYRRRVLKEQGWTVDEYNQRRLESIPYIGDISRVENDG